MVIFHNAIPLPMTLTCSFHINLAVDYQILLTTKHLWWSKYGYMNLALWLQINALLVDARNALEIMACADSPAAKIV